MENKKYKLNHRKEDAGNAVICQVHSKSNFVQLESLRREIIFRRIWRDIKLKVSAIDE